MTSQATSRRLPTTDRLAARRFALVAAEFVQRLGERIAERRKELGLTQLELALALPGKVGADQVSRWERGIHKPEDDTLEEIATVLKVPVAFFVVDKPDKASTPSPFAGHDAISDRLDAIEESVKRQLAEHAAAVEDLIEKQNGLLARQSRILKRIEAAIGREEQAAKDLASQGEEWAERVVALARRELAHVPETPQ
jgi:transcriptional regulator with XRE-family HTH domain